MLSDLSDVQGKKATLEKRLSLLSKAMDEKKKRMTEEVSYMLACAMRRYELPYMEISVCV